MRLTLFVLVAITASIAHADEPSVRSMLHHTVETTQTRAQLSEFLVGAARRAAKARDFAKAIPLYRALVVARGPGSPESKELATLWTRADQHEQAAEAWAAYAAATKDPAATDEAKRLRAASDPFADKLVLTALAADARKAFAMAKRAAAGKRYGDALVLFQMGHALAPELPGFMRELGVMYDRLGAVADKHELFLQYLGSHPIGANADVVREVLSADPTMKARLGTLVVTSSLPCKELWVSRQRLAQLPAQGIIVAPGSYKGLCFDPKHAMALFEYATVESGKSATMAFTWAIVENRLVKPFGRIALENPKAPGTLIDLGITPTEIGVAAPSDGRKLKMVLKDDTGTRTEERMVTVVPGQRLVVRW